VAGGRIDLDVSAIADAVAKFGVSAAHAYAAMLRFGITMRRTGDDMADALGVGRSAVDRLADIARWEEIHELGFGDQV